MSDCCSSERSTTPGTSAITPRTCSAEPPQLVEVVAEDLHGDVGARAREHVVDAVGDRLADGDGHAGDGASSCRSAARNSSLERFSIFRPDVDLGGVDVLGVLVELGAARAPGRGDHLGVGEQGLLDPAAQPVRLLERGARERHRRQGQRPLVEVGQEGPAEEGEADACASDEHGAARQHAPSSAARTRREDRRVARLEPVHHDALRVSRTACERREEQRAERRGHRERHHQRGRQRHHVGEAERREQPPLDAGEEEERQEDQDDDEGGEDDGAADLLARPRRPPRGRAAARSPGAGRSPAGGGTRSPRR